MLSVIIYDNASLTGALLSPLTDLRPVFDIRTGALTTLERLTLHAQLNDLAKPDGLWVPVSHVDLTRENHPTLSVNDPARLSKSLLLINGACPLADTDPTGVELGEALIDESTKTIIKAHIPHDAAAIDRILKGDATGLKIHIASEPEPVLTRPWHIREYRDPCLYLDLGMLAISHLDWQNSTGLEIFTSGSATVHPSTIFDAANGRIVIDDHAIIRPGAIIIGPAYIGPHSTVLERALIKPNTAIGPHCKVAGEIGGTIFQGFANKSHEGHLGDSWVGEWSNLGAGTTNSNLLNTYGDIICRPLGPLGTPTLRVGSSSSSSPPSSNPSNTNATRSVAVPGNERTGQQFLGATIGDHVKTAISTRIMTGAIIGTGTMFAATAPLSGTIPPLSWITDTGAKPFALDKFIEIATTVMARRKIIVSKAYLSSLRRLSAS